MRKRSKRTVRRIVAPTIVAYHLNPEVSLQERSAVLALRVAELEAVLRECRDEMKMKYTEQAVETLDDAGSVIANKNIEIEQLRQRVAELEKECDRLSELCDKWHSECDDMREANNHLANVADALMQQRDELLAALARSAGQ